MYRIIAEPGIHSECLPGRPPPGGTLRTPLLPLHSGGDPDALGQGDWPVRPYLKAD